MRLEDGRTAIVKQLKVFDGVWDELRGAFYLDWRDGEGAVRLLARDGDRMLLEHADGEPLSHALTTQGDDAATEIAAGVLEQLLHPSSRPYPPEFQPLRQRFQALFHKAGADRSHGRMTPYVEAAQMTQRLLAESRTAVPLHGDLHHDNILNSTRGWLAIDPKGVLGDPGFDAANLFYNPLDRTALCLDPQRIASMAETLARPVGEAPGRVLDWAFCYGCLSAAWHAEDDKEADEARELAIAQAIHAVRISF